VIRGTECATLRAMATASPLDPVHPAVAAAARAPLGQEDMTPEQQAELAAIVAEFEAGRARMIRQEDMPEALEEIARARRA
jgi:hypothetical protein